jgi:sugar phosphate isomerase/epimerase
MPFEFRYSVFTVMLPEQTPEEAASALHRFGYDGVEWRVTDPPSVSNAEPGYWSGNRCTVNINRLKDELPRVKTLCEAEGLQVPALGTYLSATDTGRIRECMAFARELGCPQLRVGVPGYDGSRPYPELYEEGLRQWEAVEKLAAEMGIRANVEMHMGNICPSAGLAHRFVSHFDPKHVGVIYDPGNMVIEGYENWQMGMELLGPYLAHVHAKNTEWRYGTDVHGTIRFRPDWTPIQEGIVPWDQVLCALEKVGYNGWISFEDFCTMRWDRKLKDDLAYLKGWSDRLGKQAA